MVHFKIDSAVKAEEISRKMWSILSPEDTTCTHLFGWGIDSNGQAYINVPLTMVCPVYVNQNFVTVLQQIGQLLNIPETEGRQLRQYLEGGQITLAHIVPSTLEQFTPYFQSFAP